MKIFIIIPVYNEGERAVATIKKVLRKTDNTLIVVNDGSSDKSQKIIKQAFLGNNRVILVKHVINMGKGAAMKTGVTLAFKLGGEAVIFLDADGQHNPDQLPVFEEALLKSKIVFGYRMMDKKMPWIRKWGNIWASNLIKILFNIKKKDLLSGYLGFRKEVYEKIKWHSCRYGIETEMAAKIGRNHLKFSEIRIDTIYIDKYKGVSILDALKILGQIPFWYFSK